MTLKERLPNVYSKNDIQAIVTYVGDNQQLFDELVNILVWGEERQAYIAAWVFGHSGEKYPKLLNAHLKTIITHLKNDVADGVKRAIVRVLQWIEIPEELQGELVNTCFELLENPKTAIAIKVFSMTILYNISKTQDIKQELRLVIESQLDNASSGFRSRAKKILTKL